MERELPVWVMIAVLIPIKFPLESSKGPPLQFQNKQQMMHQLLWIYVYLFFLSNANIFSFWPRFQEWQERLGCEERSLMTRKEEDKITSSKNFHYNESYTNLFPGLIAASVWIPPPIVTPAWLKISRFNPLITPTVRVWSKPKGFPIARHCCPTFRKDDCPTLIGFNRSSEASI